MWWSTDREGFVLLEAVVALAIIAMAAVALLATTGTQLRTAAKADELLVAQSLAEDRLAAVRMLDYEDLADLPDSLQAGRFPPPFQAFGWTATVAAMEDEYDLFGVEVVVTGPAEAFPVRTLVHRPRPVLAAGEDRP
ncbi:MAG TPA: hypothetical protein VE173_11905 [Longimicrobiales bacterium]|jgi:general secretion pathway protein I|nr:hypothetical protein [Longimicrobiales bacterium]